MRTMRLPLLAAAFLAIQGLSAAQSLRPALGTQAIVGAKVVVKPGQVLEKATVVMRDGRIIAVGDGVVVPPGAEVTDGAGLVVYAGFIDSANSGGVNALTAGPRNDNTFPIISELPTAMRATSPYVHLDVHVGSIFNPDSQVWAGLRNAGFTNVLELPNDGIIRGYGALINTNGEPRRFSFLRNDAALSLHLDSNYDNAATYPATQLGAFAVVRQAFMDAAWMAKANDSWGDGGAKPWNDPDLANLSMALNGSILTAIDADDYSHIDRMLNFTQEFGLRPLLWGAREAYKCIDLLKTSKAALAISLAFGREPMPTPEPDPNAKPDPNAAAPKDDEFIESGKEQQRIWMLGAGNAGKLEKAGIAFSFTTNGTADLSEFFTNLRRAVKEGLSANGALAALTTNPADMLGMSKFMGTVEAGKIANLVVFSGDFLDAKSKVKVVYIDGRKFAIGEDAAAAPRRGRRGFGEEEVDGGQQP